MQNLGLNLVGLTGGEQVKPKPNRLGVKPLSATWGRAEWPGSLKHLIGVFY